MIAALALLFVIGAILAMARIAGSDRRVGGTRRSERELLDAIDHEERRR